MKAIAPSRLRPPFAPLVGPEEMARCVPHQTANLESILRSEQQVHVIGSLTDLATRLF